MTQAKHTSGNWTVGLITLNSAHIDTDAEDDNYGPGKNSIAKFYGAKAEENARFACRLKAQRDELLDALEGILNQRWSVSGISEKNADRARAAIAKATGGQ